MDNSINTQSLADDQQTNAMPSSQWQRGDAGPAPATYVFADIPPTIEECPDGYLTSACGKYFQRENALFLGCVAIVLEPYSSNSVKPVSAEAVFGEQLRKLLWKAGLILSPDIKLETEEEMVNFFKDLSGHFLAPDEGENWLLSTGVGLWNGRLNSLTIPVENNDDWYKVQNQFHEWAKLPFEECAQKHANFIKEQLNLTINGEIKSQEDLSKIYVLLDGFNGSTVGKYSFINKEGDEWYI